MPAQSAGSRPGPTVTAMRSTWLMANSLWLFIFLPHSICPLSPAICFLLYAICPSPKICRYKIGKFLRCSLFASIGTTPPKGRWILIWEATASRSTLNLGKDFSDPEPVEGLVASTSANAVSSQLVSIAKIRINFCFACPVTSRAPVPAVPHRSAQNEVFGLVRGRRRSRSLKFSSP